MPQVATVIIFLLFLPVHYMLWNKFPIWYHPFFLITWAPMMLIGAALKRLLVQAISIQKAL